jgi:hypothetical protein
MTHGVLKHYLTVAIRRGLIASNPAFVIPQPDPIRLDQITHAKADCSLQRYRGDEASHDKLTTRKKTFNLGRLEGGMDNPLCRVSSVGLCEDPRFPLPRSSAHAATRMVQAGIDCTRPSALEHKSPIMRSVTSITIRKVSREEVNSKAGRSVSTLDSVFCPGSSVRYR